MLELHAVALLETDPLDIALGADGDIALGTDGGPYFTRGLAGVAQLCRTALLLFRGEWFRDLDAGVPWIANASVSEDRAILWQKFVDETIARAAVRDAILAVPGVLGLVSLEVAFDRAARQLTITWSARTVFGDTPADALSPGEVS